MDEHTISILEEPRADAVSLVAASATPIRYVAAEPVVEIATRDLRDDIERVTGQRPPCERGFDDLGERAILVGTYGTHDGFDREIDRIASEHGLDEQFESYLLEVVAEDRGVDAPFGTDEALVIAGSDPRGTAYGVYELSKRIGVSPWYWWANVPPSEREHLFATGRPEQAGSPSVRYRGIFLDDEDFGLREWAKRTHEPETPDGIGPTPVRDRG